MHFVALLFALFFISGCISSEQKVKTHNTEEKIVKSKPLNWHLPIIEWAKKYNLEIPKTKEKLSQVEAIFLTKKQDKVLRRANSIFFQTVGDFLAVNLNQNSLKIKSEKILFLESDSFQDIPEEFKYLNNLKALIISENQKLEQLNSGISDLKNLKALVLLKNQNLTSVSSIKNLKNLKVLFVSENLKLQKIGDLQELKNLEVLFVDSVINNKISDKNLENLKIYANINQIPEAQLNSIFKNINKFKILIANSGEFTEENLKKFISKANNLNCQFNQPKQELECYDENFIKSFLSQTLLNK
jgi:Leucine-rich repeat (LRR) protein